MPPRPPARSPPSAIRPSDRHCSTPPANAFLRGLAISCIVAGAAAAGALLAALFLPAQPARPASPAAQPTQAEKQTVAAD